VALKKTYNGVTAFVGMPGSGKTLALASIGAKAMARGERVVCNAGFDLQGAERLSTFDEFASLEGPVVVVWDELPLYFNARKWSEFPDSMLYKFTQIRKDGIQLYYSAIHEQMIDVNIRRITFWFWQCRNLGFGWCIKRCYPPEQFRKATQKPYRTSLYRIKPAIYELYDTYQKVELPKKLRDSVAAGVQEEASWASLGAAEGPPGPGAAESTGTPPGPALGDSWAFGASAGGSLLGRRNGGSGR